MRTHKSFISVGVLVAACLISLVADAAIDRTQLACEAALRGISVPIVGTQIPSKVTTGRVLEVGYGGFAKIYRIENHNSDISTIEKVYWRIGVDDEYDDSWSMKDIATMEAFELQFLQAFFRESKIPISVPEVIRIDPVNIHNVTVDGGVPGEGNLAPVMILEDIKGQSLYDFTFEQPREFRVRVIEFYNELADQVVSAVRRQFKGRIARIDWDIEKIEGIELKRAHIVLRKIAGSPAAKGRVSFSIVPKNLILTPGFEVYLVDPL